MNDDLAFVKAHIGEPPTVSGAVLLRAREAAGLPVPQEVSYEPLVLQPRRRPRRRMVSLTVTLAACVAVGAIAVAVAARPSARVSPSLGFASDAQLASATSFHMAFHAANPKCPQSSDTYLVKQPGTAKPVGLDPTACGHTFSIFGSTDGDPLVSVGAHEYAWGQVASVPTDPVTITRLIQDYLKRNPSSGRPSAGDAVADFAGIELIAPLPRAVRRGLVEAIAARPSVSSTNGHDALGRSVLWLHDRNGDVWRGVDPGSYWVIDYGSGPATAGGGPSKPGNVVTAIDTQQPPARAYPTGRLSGTVSGGSGEGGLIVTGPDGRANPEVTGGRFTIALPPGRYVITGSLDGVAAGNKVPATTVDVPAHGSVTVALATH